MDEHIYRIIAQCIQNTDGRLPEQEITMTLHPEKMPIRIMAKYKKEEKCVNKGINITEDTKLGDLKIHAAPAQTHKNLFQALVTVGCKSHSGLELVMFVVGICADGVIKFLQFGRTWDSIISKLVPGNEVV